MNPVSEVWDGKAGDQFCSIRDLGAGDWEEGVLNFFVLRLTMKG